MKDVVGAIKEYLLKTLKNLEQWNSIFSFVF